MENQVNIGVQRQFYEPFESVDSDAENSSANASLTGDSAGTNTGGNPNIVSSHVDGESVIQAPPEAAATNNTLNRYGIGDTVILGRPAYAMPDYNLVGNTTTAPNPLHSESPAARHDATSWMKEASISGSNDSGGSVDGGGDDNDYGGGGDYGAVVMSAAAETVVVAPQVEAKITAAARMQRVAEQTQAPLRQQMEAIQIAIVSLSPASTQTAIPLLVRTRSGSPTPTSLPVTVAPRTTI